MRPLATLALNAIFAAVERYNDLKEAFRLLADDKKAAEMAAYMRNRFRFYGIATPIRRNAYKTVLAAGKKRPAPDWQLLDECWDDDHREFQYFVMDYLKAMQKTLTFDDVSRMERFVRTKQWWDTIDGLDRIIGGIAFTDRRINDLMLKWSLDDDFWVRRIAIDHQLCRKQLTDTALLEKIIMNNFGSDEFFINKAIGWSLRDYSKTDPVWVADFIDRHRDEMSRLSIREATRRL